MNTELTQEHLKTILHYDPITGIFRWVRRGLNGKGTFGKVAGSKTPTEIRIALEGNRYPAHVLAWLYMTGQFPEHRIDHKDNDWSNNIWDNLRPATNSQNRANAKRNCNNTSGYKGVHKRNSKWYACINKDGKRIYLGTYYTEKAAHTAYCNAAYELFGAYARTE